MCISQIGRQFRYGRTGLGEIAQLSVMSPHFPALPRLHGLSTQTANGECLSEWIRCRLALKLRAGDIVIMDNARAHHDARVAPILRARGATVHYLPPYSPDFNPIEPAWSIVKKVVRANAPRTRTALRKVAQRARWCVTPLHCIRWAEHAGYRRRLN